MMAKKLSIDELIDEASRESFPASDSPAWVAGKDKATPDKSNQNELAKSEAETKEKSSIDKLPPA